MSFSLAIWNYIPGIRIDKVQVFADIENKDNTQIKHSN